MAAKDVSDRQPEPLHNPVPPRFQQGPLTTALQLGPLAFLAGSWRGPGFNAIWRPDNPKSRPLTNPPNQTKRFLELNLTNDSFHFQVIPGVVPNRGLNPQTDLSLYGLHYLQRTSDADPKPSKHVHPARILHDSGPSTAYRAGTVHERTGGVVQTPTPRYPPREQAHHRADGEHPARGHGADAGAQPGDEAYSRQAEHPAPYTVQHPGQRVSGAQSHALPRALPRYEPAAPAPAGNAEPAGRRDPANKPRRRPGPPPSSAGSQHDVPEININADVLVPNQPPLPGPPPPPLPAGSPQSYQSTGPFPDSFQHFIDDPNSVLREAIEDQDILGFIEINLTTDSQSTTGIPTLGVGSLFETVSNIPFLGVANQTQNPAPSPLPVSAPLTNPLPWLSNRIPPPTPSSIQQAQPSGSSGCATRVSPRYRCMKDRGSHARRSGSSSRSGSIRHICSCSTRSS